MGSISANAIQLDRPHSQSRLDTDDSRERVRIRYTIVRHFFTCKIDEDNWCTLFTRSHWIRRQQIRFMLFWCCLAVRIAMCSHRFSHYLITRLIHTRMKTNAHLSPSSSLPVAYLGSREWVGARRNATRRSRSKQADKPSKMRPRQKSESEQI